MLDFANLENIAQILTKGGVILYPTDTIWGIGCDAFNREATYRIADIKNRPRNKPFILLVDGIDRLKSLVTTIHPRIETLLHYHKRPLTVIYDKIHKSVPSHLISSEGTLGIRVTLNPICKSIIEHSDCPLISTSANFSGDPYPIAFEEINPQIVALCDYVVNPPRNKILSGEPSVIVKYSKKGELIFLRE